MYDGRSRNLGLEKSDKTVLRLATPEDGEIIVNDLIQLSKNNDFKKHNPDDYSFDTTRSFIE